MIEAIYETGGNGQEAKGKGGLLKSQSRPSLDRGPDQAVAGALKHPLRFSAATTRRPCFDATDTCRKHASNRRVFTAVA